MSSRWSVPVQVRVTMLALSVLSSAACAGTPAPAAKTPPPAPVAQPTAAPGVPAGPAVELLPAAAARGYLLASISIGSIDRPVENGTRLVNQAVPLPMDAKGVRDMLISQAGLPADISANLDFAGPSAAVFIAVGDKGESGTVLAVPARGPAEAQRVIAALGKPIMTRGPVTLVRSEANGSGWLTRVGNVVVLSDELEALSRGAQLALEARHPGADDVTAVIYPDAIARAHGTDVKTGIARLLEEARASQTPQGGAAVDEQAYESVAKMMGLAGDASSIELGLLPDPAKGLVLRARFLAREGTQLATIAHDVRPFELDAGVTGGPGTRFLVGSSSLGPFWQDVFQTYRARIAADKQKGATVALAYFDAMLASMAGQQTGVVWLGKEEPYFAGLFTSPLRDAAASAKVASALAAMDTPAAGALLRAQLGKTDLFDWTAKREAVGKVKTLHYRVKLKKTGAPERETLERVMGTSFDVYWAVARDRIVVAVGKDAKARLGAVASGKAAEQVSGALAAAQTAAKGRDAFFYFDLAPVLALAGTLGQDPRATAFARGATSPIPVVYTSGGDGAGKVYTADLTVTLAAFSAVGALIVGSMAPPPPTQGP